MAAWALSWLPEIEAEPRLYGDPPGPDSSVSLSRSDAGDFSLFDGYLLDPGKLSARSDPTASNAEILARADGDGTPRILDRLRGSFVWIVWNAQRRRLTVVRDLAGLTPCFFTWDGSALLVARRPDALLRLGRDLGRLDFAVNREAVAEYLASSYSEALADETFISKVRRLRPAHLLRLDRTGLEIDRYWAPLPGGFAWATADEAATFPQVLEAAVARCLDAGADSLALSGGFDSVSLAVLAARLRGSRAPLDAVSLHFDGGDCDESATQTAVARALGMPQTIRSLAQSLGDRNPVEAALALSGESPVPVLSVWQAFYTGLMASMRPRKSGLMLGTGGDELMAVDGKYGADCVLAASPLRLWRFYDSWRRASSFGPLFVAREIFWRHGLRAAGREILLRALDAGVPELQARILRRRWRRRIEANTWLTRDAGLLDRLERRRSGGTDLRQVREPSLYIRYLRALFDSPALMMELDQGAAWAQAQGIATFLPFFDRDVIELSLRLTPEQLLAGGESKALLRNLVRGGLPQVELPARKVGFGMMVHDVLRKSGREIWQNWRSTLRLGEIGLIQPDRGQRALDGYFAHRNNDWFLAWKILSAEAWLRHHRSRPTRPPRPLSENPGESPGGP